MQAMPAFISQFYFSIFFYLCVFFEFSCFFCCEFAFLMYELFFCFFRLICFSRVFKSRELRNIDATLESLNLDAEKTDLTKKYITALTGNTWAYYINGEAIAFANLDDLTNTINVAKLRILFSFRLLRICVFFFCFFAFVNTIIFFFVAFVELWTVVNRTKSRGTMDMHVSEV